MTDSARHKIYNIAAGQPFLTVLADSLSDAARRHAVFGACRLEEVTVLLPTRRAARELARLLLEAAETNGQSAILLPHIGTLGDLDDAGFEPAQLDGASAAALSLPPSIDGRARHFEFLKFIAKWAEVTEQEMSAVRLSALAYDLERFLDQAQNEQIDWSQLPNLVDGDLAENWQQTVDFLKIITEFWPAYLQDNEILDPVDRRNQLLAARTQKWRDQPPPGPVIAAGSTGSIRSTADLLQVISTSPRGAVILPGLDVEADEKCWQDIQGDPSHPQNLMAALLTYMDVPREQVEAWPGSAPTTPMAALVQQALVPVPQTALWAENIRSQTQASLALTHCQLIEAPDQRSEAGAVALAMRGVYEQPGQTAALVTRDRNLARRVASELRRWNIEVDDSAGQPLTQTPAAGLLRLTLRCLQDGFAPVSFLALMKHPMVCLGLARGRHLAELRALETDILRGPRPAPGLAGMARAWQFRGHKDANALLQRAGHAFAPLLALPDPVGVGTLAPALLQAAEALMRNEQGDQLVLFENGDDGRALEPFFESLMRHADLAPEVSLVDWPELFDLWLSQHSVRRLPRSTPRLFIWGPLEARLMQPDVMILGGLNEASWPPLPETGPWLSRPMRQQIGLSQPERQIGLAAHDFAQGASAPRVFVTRSMKTDGSPSVAARWLRRLETLCGGLPSDQGAQYLAWWQRLDSSTDLVQSAAQTAPRPTPRPPVSARPTSLSVTQIETLLFDPYKIYARKILGLRELEAVDAPAGASHRGSLLHGLLEQLIRDGRHLGDTIAADLLDYSRKAEAEFPGGASVMQFWQARLKAMADWFADYETQRRGQIAASVVEETGRMVVQIGGQDFTLTAKADRIDRFVDGSYGIIDYKTGSAPSGSAVSQHFAPQLTLEAAILQAGGFAEVGLPAGRVKNLDYLKLTGRTPAGDIKHIDATHELVEGALDMLKDLLTNYQNLDQPYTSHIRLRTPVYESAYDHLARFAEWRSVLDEGAGNE
ncbi:double-strand break repair protein AddB [Alphaproteobacteria bacterium]|nr:double-strand break repair protein AddB [Alphaproteobacteria bacterium]